MCGYVSSVGCYKVSYEEDVKFIFGSQHSTTDILCTDLIYLKIHLYFYIRFFMFVNSLKIIKIDRNTDCV